MSRGSSPPCQRTGTNFSTGYEFMTRRALLKHQMSNGDIWVCCGRCGALMKPVTANFKDLPTKNKSLSMDSGSQSQIYNMGDTVIDVKPSNAALIMSQMDKYDKSQLTDYQLAKKITELQLGDKKKIEQTVDEMQSEVDDLVLQAKFDDAEKLNAALIDKKKQLQLLEIQEVQAKILWTKSQLKHVPAPMTDVFEDKGRRFR